MPETPNRSISSIKTVFLTTYGLLFTGLFVILVSVIGGETWKWPVWAATFIRDVGLLLSAVMAGTIVHEKLLRDEMVRLVDEELEKRLDDMLPKIQIALTETSTSAISVLDHKFSHIPSSVSKATHQLFCENPPGMTGLKLLSEVRRGYGGYYTWVNHQRPQELFFAGRSVLHRIDADIRSKLSGSAEDVIFRRLKDGSKIKILFLDPRIDIIQRLANEEGQTPEAMIGDVARSIGISKRLFDLLRDNHDQLAPTAELTIRLYDRIPYFAYHQQDDDVTIGFYFLSSKGYSSAAYDVADEDTKQAFAGHFVRILSEATGSTLVEFDGARGRATFDTNLFGTLRTALVSHLGEDTTDRLLGNN
jgi:hypothetical protein